MEGQRALSRPLPGVEGSTYGVAMSLSLGCRIFLSHSGSDKNFVRFLHEKLCDRYHDDMEIFFDEETLPKAKAISMENILGEARRSQLAVLVLTEAFFVQTPNPMLELEAFVTSEVTLLPLFFGISVNNFKEKKQRIRWEEHWRMNFGKELSGKRSVEEGIVAWRRALDHVTVFNGLEYEKMATNHLQYIHEIVDKVTSIIPSNSFIKEGICGKKHMCQMVDNMYKDCAKKHSGRTVLDVVGIHGFSGLGKTTLCKCLCDFYFREFSGKVCYIELRSLALDQASSQKLSFSSRLQKVLSNLGMNTKNDFFNLQDIDQVKNWFKKKISFMKDPIFFAIDNILPELEYQEEVEFYLGCKFSKGSKIFITSRSEDILNNLVSQHNHNISAIIEYMPALDFEAAKEIFMIELPKLSELEIVNLEDGINKCVNMCTIHERRYHPLMLNSLAALVKWNRSLKNIDWKGRLAKLCSEGITDKDDAWKRVYKMFDMSYDLLTKEAQKVFLDLALFYNATRDFEKMFKWIEKLYFHLSKDIEKIILQLEDLCFVDRKEYKILDLIVDYSKYKASERGLESEYVVLEDGAPGLDDSPRMATTVSISRCGHQIVDLRNVEGVKVLHIVHNAGLQEVLLSPAITARLRSLIVRVPAGTSLVCIIDEDWPSMSAPCAGKCLQWVDLKGDVCFRSSRLSERRSLRPPSNVLPNSILREVAITSARVAPDLVALLGGLRNLEHLKLSKLPGVRSIDVTTCSNLKVLRLYEMRRLELINVGFENPNLESVVVDECPKLLAFTGIPAHSKARFSIGDCDSLERISFCTMSSQCAGALSSRTRPGSFLVQMCPAVTNIEGLSQYTGSFGVERSAIGIKRPSRACMTSMGEICGDSGLQLDAGFDLSLFSATIDELKLTKNDSAGARLASATRIKLTDAQHAGLFISALFKAQPEDLQHLSVRCNGVDCGCDQNVPHFGPLPSRRTPECRLNFLYECRQVKDLASLAQCHVLQGLTLDGCTSVEIWPDFAAMTSLQSLRLNNTSLKEWPTGVLRLSHLHYFRILGCQQLPAEELIKVSKFALQPATLGNEVCIMQSLQALREDLWQKTRDRCSVADALDAVYPEFVALFESSLTDEFVVFKRKTLTYVIRIMYELWFEEVDSEEERLHIRTRMRSLLCSERFLAFSFRACSQDALSEAWDWRYHSNLTEVGLMGIALVGSSIAWYEAPMNDDLRDRIIIFLKNLTQLHTPYGSFEDRKYSKVSERIENMVRKMSDYDQSEKYVWNMRQRVGEGVCRMARVESVAAELGETFLHTIIHDLETNLEITDRGSLYEMRRDRLYRRLRLYTYR